LTDIGVKIHGFNIAIAATVTTIVERIDDLGKTSQQREIRHIMTDITGIAMIENADNICGGISTGNFPAMQIGSRPDGNKNIFEGPGTVGRGRVYLLVRKEYHLPLRLAQLHPGGQIESAQDKRLYLKRIA
jgi:hypothetical protein